VDFDRPKKLGGRVTAHAVGKNENQMNEDKINDKYVHSDSLQPLEEFEIQAAFLKLSVLLWNVFMTFFCILSVIFAASKIAHGDISVGILFIIAFGTLIPRELTVCGSAFGGNLVIYQDRIVQKGAFGQKTVRFSKAYTKVNSPKFAGGPVLYFTESRQNSKLKRLRTIYFLNDVMIIHLWMLPDTEVHKLVKLLSNLSGRPESAFQPIQCLLQPFYNVQGVNNVSN
jgi:hypothetical protein